MITKTLKTAKTFNYDEIEELRAELSPLMQYRQRDIVDDDIIENVEFYGGCNGNLQGISALIKGMDIDEVVEKIAGLWK